MTNEMNDRVLIRVVPGTYWRDPETYTLYQAYRIEGISEGSSMDVDNLHRLCILADNWKPEGSEKTEKFAVTARAVIPYQEDGPSLPKPQIARPRCPICKHLMEPVDGTHNGRDGWELYYKSEPADWANGWICDCTDLMRQEVEIT